MGYEWKIKSKLVKDNEKGCKLNIMLHYFGCSSELKHEILSDDTSDKSNLVLDLNDGSAYKRS